MHPKPDLNMLSQMARIYNNRDPKKSNGMLKDIEEYAHAVNSIY